MIPRKAEQVKDAPKGPETPKVEAAPVAKQAAFAKQEGPGPGPKPALAPSVAPKTDKAKKAKIKPMAPSLAPEHPTRTLERFNKGVPRQGSDSKALY